jgi:Protein of unknown function (DUF998)
MRESFGRANIETVASQKGRQMSQTDANPRFVRRISRLALAATLGISIFAFCVVALHFLRPEYDPRQRFMSEFAVGPYGFVMTLAFFALGLGAFALALGFHGETRLSGRRWHGPLLFGLCGADLLLVALFPSDLQGAPARTTTGIIHDWASTPPFLFILLAMPLLVRHFQNEAGWRTFRYPTFALGIAALTVRVATLVPFGIAWSGLTQRLLASLILGWLLLATLYLRTHALGTSQNGRH